MSGLIDAIVNWGQRLVEALGYPGLAVIMFLENVFPPVPSEPFLLGAGFQTARGSFGVLPSLLAATLGATAGACVFYVVGMACPEAGVRRLLDRYGRYLLLEQDDFDRALAWFQRYGAPVVFFGRCVPIVRTLISVPAGLARMPLGRFLALTAAGSATWSLALILVGRALGERWERALALLDRYELAVYLLAVAGAALFVAARLRQRGRRRALTRS